jgi:hypothetical protein
MSHANIMLVKFAVAIVIMGHWMACTWCMVAHLEVKHSWLTALTGSDWDDVQLSKFDIYSAALYWAVVTITRLVWLFAWGFIIHMQIYANIYYVQLLFCM